MRSERKLGTPRYPLGVTPWFNCLSHVSVGSSCVAFHSYSQLCARTSVLDAKSQYRATYPVEDDHGDFLSVSRGFSTDPIILLR
jgi:hypothetical protein